MGCCLSTNSTPLPKKSPHISTAKHGGSVSKSPPPTHPLPDEETVVKEVLTETPKRPSPVAQRNRRNESPFIRTAPLLVDFSRTSHVKGHQHGAVFKKPLTAVNGADGVSFSEEVSEICSTLGESESASTTLTEKRENNGEQRLRSPARVNRSFSGEVKREKTVERSPGRRPEPSPGRTRPGQGPGYGKRRDSGESSGRRSRSPVMRAESGSGKTGMGRSPSTRKTGKSPGRVGSGLGERIRRVDEGKESEEMKWPPTTNNELLENPLVSLECFIFL